MSLDGRMLVSRRVRDTGRFLYLPCVECQLRASRRGHLVGRGGELPLTAGVQQ